MAVFNVHPRGNLNSVKRPKSIASFRRGNEEFETKKALMEAQTLKAGRPETSLFDREKFAFEQKKT